MRTLSDLLKHCEASGLTMICYYDDPAESDYQGTDSAVAKVHLEACGEMRISIRDSENKRRGYAFIVNDTDSDPEGQIAGHSTNDRLDACMSEGAAA